MDCKNSIYYTNKSCFVVNAFFYVILIQINEVQGVYNFLLIVLAIVV